MDVIEQYKQLKQQKEKLSTELTSKEATFKTLKAQYDEELKKLCEEYGVSTLEEAEKLYETKAAELEAKIKDASAQIRLLNGSAIDTADLGL